MGMNAGYITIFYVDETGREYRVCHDIDRNSIEARFLSPVNTTDDSLFEYLDNGRSTLRDTQRHYEKLRRRSEVIESISKRIASHLLNVISAKDAHNGYPKESEPTNQPGKDHD